MRNPVLDIMKGIGIVLVLIGHIPDTSAIFSIIKSIIYSFHMPMFFVLAGYCNKSNALASCDRGGGYCRKKFNRLIIPFIVSYFLLIAWSCLKAFFNHNWMMPCRHLLSMLWGSQEIIGSDVFSQFFGGIYITHTWFLWAMFWGIVLFSLIVKLCPKYYLWICIVLSYAACLSFSYTELWCPWSIMEGLGALSFIAIGYWIKNHRIPLWGWLICIVGWALSIIFFPLNMASNSYACYPINIIGGLGGTYCIYWLGVVINKHMFSRQFWITLGTISLPILCFHEIEPLTDIANSLRLRLMPYFVLDDSFWIIIRYICVVVFAYLCSRRIKCFRKIYVR